MTVGELKAYLAENNVPDTMEIMLEATNADCYATVDFAGFYYFTPNSWAHDYTPKPLPNSIPGLLLSWRGKWADPT